MIAPEAAKAGRPGIAPDARADRLTGGLQASIAEPDQINPSSVFQAK
jgi:hypothetical protein